MQEHNARVHLFAAVAAVCIGIFLQLSALEWIAVIVVIGLVFITEIMNTAIENMANFVSPEYHVQIKVIKDLAAAAVLIAAITAVVTAVFIFLPKFIALF